MYVRKINFEIVPLRNKYEYLRTIEINWSMELKKYGIRIYLLIILI